LEITCIVLAGGKSTRLGRNKITEIIGNKTLLERVLSQLSFLKSEIIVVTAQDTILPQSISVDYPKLRVVNDIIPGKGSLGGIYTGLVHSTSFYNLVVASDMPFLNRRLLLYMIEAARDVDLVVPRMGDILEPLHAVYSKNCVAPIEDLLKQDDLRIYDFYDRVRIRYIEAEEIDKFDPERLSFFNINTPSNLNKALELVEREDFKVDQC
jgi:molybdenum cofactor guanylyltransferase